MNIFQLFTHMLPSGNDTTPPLTFEVAGQETDFMEGDIVIHTAPSGLQVIAQVEYVKFEPSCGLNGAWMAFIAYQHKGLDMTAYTGFDSLESFLLGWQS